MSLMIDIYIPETHVHTLKTIGFHNRTKLIAIYCCDSTSKETDISPKYQMEHYNLSSFMQIFLFMQMNTRPSKEHNFMNRADGWKVVVLEEYIK